MRLLGVDFGFARIGVAVGETAAKIATPRPTMAASGTLKRDAQALHDLACREEVEAIVLGYPLGDEGEEGKMARVVRQLQGHLEALGHRVTLVDESMTSVQAETTMFEAGLKGSERRKRRDGEAACLILQRAMESHD